MDNKVLTQEEIQQLTQIQDKRSLLVEKFGILEFKIQSLLIQKELIQKELIELTEFEIKTGEIFQEKYGNGTVDMDKGEFVSSN